MARGDHLLVDPIQQLGGEQAQVVLQRLQVVAGVIGPIAVAEHLAQCAVLVGQLVNPVDVGVQSQTQGAEHQDLPLLHAGAARARVRRTIFAIDGARGDDLGEDREHTLTQLAADVDVLQTAQDLGNVVTRFGIKLDGGNILFTELHLRVDDSTHRISNDEDLMG